MAKNSQPGKTPQAEGKTRQAEGKTPQAERSIGRGGEQVQEPGAPASSGAQVLPGSPGAPASKEAARPKSPREFIQERMRQLDKKGS
jgi:hypothetical protein